MTKIYTKTGDGGETGLFAGPRVPKDHPRIEAYGSVDELNTILGVVRTESLPAEADELLQRVQCDLFTIGAELATPDPGNHQPSRITAADVRHLEQQIDAWETKLPPLKQFILPGGTKSAAWLHVARAICRRAERRVISLRTSAAEPVSDQPVVYLNRLSDLLFVLARGVNALAGCEDIPWEKRQVDDD